MSDGESRPANWYITDLVDASSSYVRRFKFDHDERIVIQRKQIGRDYREHILSRDEGMCVKCGSENDLEVHHIIPYEEEGEFEPANLATLCSDCHFEAHDEEWGWGDVTYDSCEEFWNWVDS